MYSYKNKRHIETYRTGLFDNNCHNFKNFEVINLRIEIIGRNIFLRKLPNPKINSKVEEHHEQSTNNKPHCSKPNINLLILSK